MALLQSNNGFATEIIEKFQNEQALPTLPNIVQKLLDLVSDVNAGINDVAEIISYDPSISSKILKLANSVVYGGSEKIGAIDQAVMRIGFDAVKDIVVSLSIIDMFSNNHQINYKDFWKHSLSVAFGAQVVETMSTGMPKPSEETYMCGLLHDLGILLLDQFLSDHYPNVLEEASKFEKELYEIEQEILGIDHAQVGAILMERWQLPTIICDAVSNQYTPCAEGQENPVITKSVHIANFACNNQEITNGIESLSNKFSQIAWFDMNLSVSHIPMIIDTVNTKLRHANAILSAANRH